MSEIRPVVEPVTAATVCHYCGREIGRAWALQAKPGNAWAHVTCWYDSGPLGVEAALAEFIRRPTELQVAVAERDQLASELQEAREVLGNLRTAAREVGAWFTFSGPGTGRFAGHKLTILAEEALLSLHDFANDGDILLGDSIDTERLGKPKP